MAQKKINYSFSKAIIEKNEDGIYTITEIGKDDTTEYNLSDIVDKYFVGVPNLSLRFSVDDEITG